MPSKDSLKDRVDGNVLDLSLLELTSIPVNELAGIPKAVQLDLSCNLLITIPNDINRLSHLIHLDLSKNQLTSIPDSIGGLHKLQHLDLYQNKLTTLPVGFCHLKNLKWLDVKDNPLQEALHSVTGDCLDDKQCRSCAQKVVAFMKSVNSEQERIKQKKLAIKREEEAKKKAEEEKELDRIRQLKKAQRQARKLEKSKAQLEKAEEASKLRNEQLEAENLINDKLNEINRKESRCAIGWFGLLIGIIVLIIASYVGLYFYCQKNSHHPQCVKFNEYNEVLEKSALDLFDKSSKYTQELYVKFLTISGPLIEQLKERFLYVFNNVKERFIYVFNYLYIYMEPKVKQMIIYLQYVFEEVRRITEPFIVVIVEYLKVAIQQLHVYGNKLYIILEDQFTILQNQISNYFNKT